MTKVSIFVSFFAGGYSMTERLFSPKTILTAVRDISFTNLRHLRTRKDMNFIKPFILSTKKGQKNLYSVTEALKYILSCKFEDSGFDIQTSANMAEIIISCRMYAKNDLWIIYMFGETPKDFTYTLLNRYHKPTIRKSIEDKLKNDNIKYFFLNPLPETYFYFQEDDFNQHINKIGGKVTRMEFINISELINDSLKRLNISQDEFEKIAIKAAHTYEKITSLI